MGHSWARKIQVVGAYVLSERKLRRRGLRYHTSRMSPAMLETECRVANGSSVITRQSQGMGKGASAASQREHHHRIGGKQGRSGNGTPRQTCRYNCGCRGLLTRGWLAVLRNLGQDCGKCTGPVHGYCEEIAD